MFAILLTLFLAPAMASQTMEVIIQHEKQPSINAFSTQSNTDVKKFHETRTVTHEEYEALKKEGHTFVRNDKVHTMLADSIPLIGADTVHNSVLDGTNFTGKGQTACVIDTGVDYTHSAFGSCQATFTNTSVNFTLNSSQPFDDSVVENDVSFTFWDISNSSLQYPHVFFEEVVIDAPGDKVCLYYNSFELDCISSNITNISLGMLPSNNNIEVGIRRDVSNNESNTSFKISALQNNDVEYDCDRFLGGFDFVDQNNDPMDEASGSHGTHVAGIFGGDDDEIRGVAPEANIVAVRSLDSNDGGQFINVKKGIEYCIENKEKYNISTIIMSLGTNADYDTYCDSNWSIAADLVTDAASKNITVASATGNDFSTTNMASPACLENSFRVGGSTKSDGFLSMTNRNSFFTDMLLAPGENIRSSIRNQAYDNKKGTSMAAPHLAGLSVLIQQQRMLTSNDPYTNTEMFNLLNTTGVPIFDSGTGLYYNRISALQSLGPRIEINLTEEIEGMKDNQSINYTVTTELGNIVEKNITVYNPDGTVLAFEENLISDSLFVNAAVFEEAGNYSVVVKARNSNNVTNQENSSFIVTVSSDFDVNFTGFEPGILFHTLDDVTFNVSNFSQGFNVSLFVDDFFVSNYSEGENDSLNFSEGVYNFSFVLEESPFWNENQQDFEVNVTNLTPVINSVEPSNQSLFIDRGDVVEFSTNTSNPSSSLLNSSWYVNNSLVADTSTYAFNSSNLSAGNYSVLVNNSNRYGFDSYTWNVIVEEADLSNFTVTFFGNDSDLTYHFEELVRFNVSNFSHDFNIDFYIDGVLNDTFSNDTSKNVSLPSGVYNFSFLVEESSNWSASQQDFEVNVTNLAPVINTVQPSNQSLIINKNELVNFSTNTTNPSNNPLNSSWHLNNTLVTDTSTYTLNASTLTEGNYTVLLNVSNTYGTTSYSWNVSIVALDSSISINSFPPNTTNVTINQFNNELFKINASSNTALSYSWMFNNTLVSTTPSYLVNTSLFSVGNYSLNVTVNNSEEEEFVSWNVFIEEAPSLSITSFSPNTSSVNTGLNQAVMFNQTSVDSENNSLSYEWLVDNSSVSTNQNFTFTQGEVGSYNVSFIVSNEWNNVSRSVLVHVFNNSIDFFNDVSDVEFDEDDSVTININDHFNYSGYLDLSVSLSNTDLSSSFNGELLEISGDPGEFNTNIFVENNDFNATSNDFSVTINEVSTPRSGGGGGGGLPPPTDEEADDEVVEDVEEDIVEDVEEDESIEEVEEVGFVRFVRSIVENSFNFVSSREENTLQRLFVRVQSTLSDFSLEIQESDDYIDVDRPVYKFIVLSYNDSFSDEFDEATLKFKVRHSWLVDQNISVDDVSLHRLKNNDWEVQNTTHDHSGETFAYFTSSFTGLSVFSIMSVEQEEIVVSESVDEPRNWWTLIFGFLALTLVTALFLSIKLNRVDTDTFDKIKPVRQQKTVTKEDDEDVDSDEFYTELLQFKTSKRRQSLERLLRKTTKTDDLDELKKLYLLIMKDYEKLEPKKKKLYQDRILEVYDEIRRLQK